MLTAQLLSKLITNIPALLGAVIGLGLAIVVFGPTDCEPLVDTTSNNLAFDLQNTLSPAARRCTSVAGNEWIVSGSWLLQPEIDILLLFVAAGGAGMGALFGFWLSGLGRSRS